MQTALEPLTTRPARLATSSSAPRTVGLSRLSADGTRCPISLGFNNSAAPFDKPEMRQAINFAIDRTKLVNLAEAGAGVLAYHQFTPYVWFQKFDDAIKPTEQKDGLDATAHPDKVNGRWSTCHN